ncbi:DUF2490 domain-containing protein [Spirosoma jeollabukense]
MSKVFIVASLLICITTPSFSQDRYLAGTLPQVNVNFSLPNKVKLNTKLESRQLFTERKPNEADQNRFRYERTDLALVLTKKVSLNSTLGGGYLIRLEDHQFVHRLIQQANLVNDLALITVAHRVVVDETFRQTEPLEVRVRYRLSLEKALNGREIDANEMYVKFNNEYLGIWASNRTDLEIRGSLALGYNAVNDTKIELGFEYRVNEFDQPRQAHQYWATISWFITI